MLLDRLLASVGRHPDKLAACDDRMQLTYAQLERVVGILARITLARAREPQVGVMLPACAAFPAAFYGLRWAGKVAVPLNFLLQPHELRTIVQHAGVRHVLTVRHFERLVADAGLVGVYLDDIFKQLRRLSRWLGWLPAWLRPKPPRRHEPEPDALAVMLYTSGTTGRPKGVMLSERNLAANVDGCIQLAQMNPDQSFLSVLPKFHSFGLTALTLAPLTVGGVGHFIPRFTPQAVVDAVERLGISMFCGVPSMYGAIARLRKPNPNALRSLVLPISGAEPLPSSVARAMQERFGVTLCEGYGMTEAGPVISLSRPGMNKPGCVGKPLPSWELTLRDTVMMDGQTVGELCVRGPSRFLGYHQDPEATQAAIDDAGWLRTGDLVTLDADGYLAIKGRCKDLIIVAGENVYPPEVEEALCEHPAVAAAAVLGMPDELRGEAPVAFVQLAEGATATAQELRDHCRQRLAAFKAPREVRLMSQMPLGPTGKVLKRALRQQLG